MLLRKFATLIASAMLLSASLASTSCSAQSDKPKQHEFVAIDEGLNSLFYISQQEPSKNWKVKLDLPKARDLQLIGNGRLLVGYGKGYAEFDLRDGNMLKNYDGLAATDAEVTSARRQPDGTTLIAGVNIGGQKGVSILQLGADDKILKITAYPGDYVRLLRQTAQGTYLLCCNTEIREASTDGKYLKTYPVEGFKHMWKVVRLPNNHMIASAGYGAFMVELDQNGKLLRKWGEKGQVPDAVNSYFAATFQLLSNNHVVLANWQGHGPNHGKSGVQLLEYDETGKIVWQWSQASMISSLQGVLVLDGLDTTRLHDERDGVMNPL